MSNQIICKPGANNEVTDTMAWFYILLLLNIIVQVTYGGCPYMKNSLNQGKHLFQNELENNQILRQSGFVVKPDEAFFGVFLEYAFPDDIINLMHNATAMVLTEQYYELRYLTNTTGKSSLTIPEKIEHIEYLSECLPKSTRCRPEPTCDPEAIYRTMDGSCNNLKRPKQGATFNPYNRLLPASYNDGLYEIRRTAKTNQPLNSPRLVGNIVYSKSAFVETATPLLNLNGLLLSQMLAHDIGNVVNRGAAHGSDGFRCCSSDYSQILPKHVQADSCDPIDTPINDPYFSQYNITCLNYIRAQTSFNDDCQLGSASQMSITTGYIDASQIYGRDDTVAATVRSFVGGQLSLSANDLLVQQSTGPGVLVADPRQLTSSILLEKTIVFLRFHNYIASELAYMHSDWNDEKLYQESRRIFIAIYQHLLMDGWARIFLSDAVVDTYLSCSKNGGKRCHWYDENRHGGALSDFSAGAFRFLHALLPDEFCLQSNETTKTKCLKFSEIMGNYDIVRTEFEEVLNGALYQPAWMGDYVSQIRDHAFPSANGIGADLSSIDLSRSRDFGVQPYYKYAEFCQPENPKIENWEDLLPNIAADNITRLMEAYDSVHDVDLLVGMFAERKVGNGYLGAVGTCLYVEQLYRLIVTDRFYYNLNDATNPFTHAQLDTIKRTDVASILCQVTDVGRVPRNALLVPSETNPVVDCSEIPYVDLSAWQ